VTESSDRRTGPDSPDATSDDLPGSQLRERKRRQFLVPAAGAWILALDWVLFSSSALTAWLATPVAMIAGFVLGGAGVYLIQRRATGDTRGRAALKALLAAIVVGLPWPLGGTLVGGWVLLSSGLKTGK
jgi:hypothetical protein